MSLGLLSVGSSPGAGVENGKTVPISRYPGLPSNQPIGNIYLPCDIGLYPSINRVVSCTGKVPRTDVMEPNNTHRPGSGPETAINGGQAQAGNTCFVYPGTQEPREFLQLVPASIHSTVQMMLRAEICLPGAQELRGRKHINRVG